MSRNEQIISNYKEKILNDYLNESIPAAENIFSHIKPDKLLQHLPDSQIRLFFKRRQSSLGNYEQFQLKKLKFFSHISRIFNTLLTKIWLINKKIDHWKEFLLMISLANSFHIRKFETSKPISESTNSLLGKTIKSVSHKVIISKRDIELSKIKRLIYDIYECNEVSSIETSVLNKISIIHDNSLLDLIPKHLTPELQELLYKVILFSKESDAISLAATNAATILNRSNFLWKNLDLSGIKIPFADLSKGLFINVNFEKSNLQGVNFQQSSIEFTNFNGCNLSDIPYNEKLHIKTTMFKEVQLISFSACGKYIGVMDSRFYIWSVEEQKETNKFGKILKQVLSFSFSSAGGCIALCLKGHIQIREIESEQIIQKIKGKFDFVLFSPNNAYLLAMSKNITYFWSPETFKLVVKFENWAVQRKSIKFSQNSKYIAGHYYGTITVWEISNKKKIDLDLPHSNNLDFSFFPNEKYLAITSDNPSELWDFNPEGNLTKLNICSDIKKIEFSPCGKFALLMDHNKTMRIWSIDTDELIELYEKCECQNVVITFSQCGKYLAFNKADSLIRVIKLPDKNHTRPRGFTSGVSCISLSSSGRYLASGHFVDTVKLWDMNNFTLIGTFGGWQDDSYSKVYSIAFSSCEKYLIFAISSKIYIYDIDTKLCVHVVHQKYIQQTISLAISWNGALLAYADSGGYCFIWDLNNSVLLHTLETLQCMRNQLLFSPCQRYFAYGYKDAIRLWNLESQTYTNFEAFGSAFAFSPCKKFLATLKTGYVIEIWNLDSLKKTSEIQLHEVDSNVFTFTYSPCSSYLICYHRYSRTEEHIILSVWNALTKKQITHFNSHIRPFDKAYNTNDNFYVYNSLVCAGRYIACGGYDGIIKIWNLDCIARGLPLEESLEYIFNLENIHIFNCSFTDAIISNKSLKSIVDLQHH